MSGTSYARILFFFLFFLFRSPLSPFPPALRFFFSGLVSIDLRAFFCYFPGIFFNFFTEF